MFSAPAAFEAMQEQVRKNFATFKRALGLFSPFSATNSGDGGKGTCRCRDRRGGEAKAPNSKPERGRDRHA